MSGARHFGFLGEGFVALACGCRGCRSLLSGCARGLDVEL